MRTVYAQHLLCALLLLGACAREAPSNEVDAVVLSCGAAAVQPDPAHATEGMVFVRGGVFTMGAEPMHSEEGPPQEVRVADFWIDRTEVTNAQFAKFVEATGYVTLAERPLDPAAYPGVPPEQLAPSSLVFVQPTQRVGWDDPSNWWRIIRGANWRHPQGPGSSIEGKEEFPVVHVAYDDALAYARWAGRELPTEAEWEYAAQGGREASRYSWGSNPPTASDANVWQGTFPSIDTGADGHRARTAPVGCFRANGFGLFDMAGNVWEWTSTWYRPGIESDEFEFVEPTRINALDPAEPGVPKHVAKGGSFLCAENFCLRYRPSARTAGPPDTGSSHIGFRTIVRARA